MAHIHGMNGMTSDEWDSSENLKLQLVIEAIGKVATWDRSLHGDGDTVASDLYGGPVSARTGLPKCHQHHLFCIILCTSKKEHS